MLLSACRPDFKANKWDKVDVRLLVGAIEVLSGKHEVFDTDKELENRNLKPPKGDEEEEIKRWRIRRPFVLEGVAASGTLPQPFKAHRIKDLSFPGCELDETIMRDGFYWDGLYPQNPPVRDFLDPLCKTCTNLCH